jgi:hypothetical protein
MRLCRSDQGRNHLHQDVDVERDDQIRVRAEPGGIRRRPCQQAFIRRRQHHGDALRGRMPGQPLQQSPASNLAIDEIDDQQLGVRATITSNVSAT